MRGYTLVIALGAAVSTAHAEKAVYKCSGPNGSTVFSPTPCGKNAKEVEVSKTSSLSPPSTLSNDAVRDISDSVSDIRCRDSAQKLYSEPDTSAIARAQSQLAEIQGRSWYSEGNPAAAQLMANEDATRVVALRNLIATEQTRVDSQRSESRKRVDDALRTCDEQKRVREGARAK